VQRHDDIGQMRDGTSERGKRGNDASWTDVNLTVSKNEENLHS
jgi:hypothetical protein